MSPEIWLYIMVVIVIINLALNIADYIRTKKMKKILIRHLTKFLN